MAQLSTRSANVWLLHLKYSLGMKGRLSLHVIRKICSYFPDLPTMIAQVTNGFLHYFDLSTWGPLIRLST